MSAVDKKILIKRLKKYPILQHFSEEILQDLVHKSEIIEVDPDQFLFTNDEPSLNVYYMIDGCIEVYSSKNCDNLVSLVRSGDMIGEMGVVAGEPYGLTAKVHRTSHLLKIDHLLFLAFIRGNPSVLMQLTKSLASRLRNVVTGLYEKNYPIKNLVLYMDDPALDIAKLKETFQKAAADDSTTIFDKSAYNGKKDEIVAFLAECENTHGVNIFLLEPSDDPWTQAVIIYVEYIYIVSSEGNWNKVNQKILDCLKRRPCDLVICHEKSVGYQDTNKFYERYSFKRHHHITNNTSDFQRIYRYMTGQAYGLVISGGGFRGYVHYGLIKALTEAGVPIDAIGGASMGAVVGAGLAINPDWKRFNDLYEQSMLSLRKKGFFNITLPIFSLLSGEVATKTLKKTYKKLEIENLPTNFWCVVSNLSERQKEIKHYGTLWEWLRASMAIPGIFPPFEKNGNLYVDGGLCSNLPVQDMREYLDNSGTIITLDISVSLLQEIKYLCPPVLTLKEALLYKLGLSNKDYIFPSLLEILLESSCINQYINDTQGAMLADITIDPDTSELSTLNPKATDPLSLLAYKFAKEILEKEKSQYLRWL